MYELTQNWIKLAQKELRLAEAALNINEPIGIIQHLHATIEKLLKAIYQETKGNPPKIHNLKRLALDCCGLTLEEKKEKLLDILDKAFIDSRYPTSIELFESKHNIDSCKLLIQDTKEVTKWLQSLLKNS